MPIMALFGPQMECAGRMDGAVTYIYNVNYEMPILKGIIRKLEEEGLVYVVNPAFVPGLQIRGNDAS